MTMHALLSNLNTFIKGNMRIVCCSIDMGSPVWAYTKIVQTILQEAGFDVV